MRTIKLLALLLVASPVRADPVPDGGAAIAPVGVIPLASTAIAVPPVATNPAIPFVPAACTECARQLFVTSSARGWPAWASWTLGGVVATLGVLDQLHGFGVIR